VAEKVWWIPVRWEKVLFDWNLSYVFLLTSLRGGTPCVARRYNYSSIRQTLQPARALDILGIASQYLQLSICEVSLKYTLCLPCNTITCCKRYATAKL
jgi:hypothetical protein